MFQAYAVYDEDLGYVQGLSFLAAALLLHVSPSHIVFTFVAFVVALVVDLDDILLDWIKLAYVGFFFVCVRE